MPASAVWSCKSSTPTLLTHTHTHTHYTETLTISLLFIASLIVSGLALHRHRSFGLHCVPGQERSAVDVREKVEPVALQPMPPHHVAAAVAYRQQTFTPPPPSSTPGAVSQQTPYYPPQQVQPVQPAPGPNANYYEAQA